MPSGERRSATRVGGNRGCAGMSWGHPDGWLTDELLGGDLMNRNIRRGVVALAAVFAHLAILASPVSAAVVSFDVTAGTVTFINSTGTATDSFPLGPGVSTLGTACSVSTQITTTASTTSVTNWQVTSWSVIDRIELNNVWYIQDQQRTGSTTGTITGITTTGATLNASTINLAINLYTATDQSDTSTNCTHGLTRICRFANFGYSLQGTYSGNIHTPATSDTATLNGSGGMGTTSPPCFTPFTVYNGGSVTVAGMVIHVL